MTFEQLEYFIAVADHPTFFDAAENLHITQSALSKQIMKLERELGVSLLDRSRRTASLTAVGEMFYNEALSLINSYHQSLEKIRTYQQEQKQVLQIGTLPILSLYHLDSKLQQFRELHPAIELRIDEVEEVDLMNHFESDQYDFIITRGQMLQNIQCSKQLLTEDELVVVLAADHPLAIRNAQSNCISFDALTNEKFILMNPYTSIYQTCISLFKDANMNPEILRTARTESILGAVSIGEGISLLAKSNLDVFHLNNITALALSPSVKLPIYIASKKKHKKEDLGNQFLDFLSPQ